MFKKILSRRGRQRFSRFGTASFNVRVCHPATRLRNGYDAQNYRGMLRSVNDFFVEA
jgi:hypothetical protein